MRLLDPRLWLGTLSAAGVLWLAVQDIEKQAPGPLSTPHERVPELAARNACSECHGDGPTTLSDKCSACHEDVAWHVETGRGLHGALHEDVAPQCSLCHSEHHGTSFVSVNARSFFIAGIPDVAAFDHERVGWRMHGPHADLECTKCHEHAEATVIGEGQRRWMGLSRDCASCHEDPHEGRMERSCAECHGQESFGDWTPFAHDERFPLVGGHAAPACVDCHAPESAFAVEALDALERVEPRECTACHESPHDSGFVEGLARLVGERLGASCAACHRAEHPSFRGAPPAQEVTRERHAASGFPLLHPHHEAGCAECHEPAAQTFAERFPGRGPNECAACHPDPHGGQFAESVSGAHCLACHDRHAFEPHGFTVERHAEAALALEGRHAETACETCHVVPGGGAPRAFHGTPSDCDACHADAHRGFFAPVLAGLPPVANGDCARCHGAASFRELPHGFDHGRATGFALAGAHRQAACESCHPRAATPDATGRTLGRVAAHFGPVAGCASCHVDPHRGGFDAPGLSAAVDGRAGCARCHSEVSFRAFPHGFDHGRWTGFPLDGAHAVAGCAACHERRPRPDDAGRTWGPAAGAACVTCHADPHAAQFDEGGRAADCARCHSTTSFTTLVFDHDRDARFPLDRNHRALDCAACHKPWKHRGKDVVRYKPMGVECADCHDVGDGRLRRGRKR